MLPMLVPPYFGAYNNLFRKVKFTSTTLTGHMPSYGANFPIDYNVNAANIGATLPRCIQ